MRTHRALLAALVLVLVGALAPTGSSAIKIAKIRYNPPGADTGSNAHLNKEWITIRNTGDSPRNLSRWTIRDRAGHVRRIGLNPLRPGATVKIHTGRGTSSPHHLYWGMGNYVWNNDRDRATLKNGSGKVIDRCSYSSSSASAKVC